MQFQGFPYEFTYPCVPQIKVSHLDGSRHLHHHNIKISLGVRVCVRESDGSGCLWGGD